MTPLGNLGFDSIDQAMTYKKISLDKSDKDFVVNMIL